VEAAVENFIFRDALTGDDVSLDLNTNNAFISKNECAADQHESIFFPGCSFLNYASALVPAVLDTLKLHGLASGVSILCCGKILAYDPNTKNLCSMLDDLMRKHLLARGVKRVICACPNCVETLRRTVMASADTKHIEICALPNVLSSVGYRVDSNIASQLLAKGVTGNLKLCTHDSCPDRHVGEFARGLRQILPEGMWVDPKHCCEKSVCCGSSVRAQGKHDAADACVQLNIDEAHDVEADAIVTACMSCAFQLGVAQAAMPVVHYLELLYNWRIDWPHAIELMKIRFLFDEVAQAELEQSTSGRQFGQMNSTCSE
jgi:Fe-S oxidoreductase